MRAPSAGAEMELGTDVGGVVTLADDAGAGARCAEAAAVAFLGDVVLWVGVVKALASIGEDRTWPEHQSRPK